jgi:hypothetical protein
VAQQKSSNKKPRSSTILTAVVFTVISAIVVYGVLLVRAKDHFRIANNVADETVSPLLGHDYTQPAQISISMLPWSDLFVRVFLPVAAFTLVYPLIGRGVAQLATETTRGINEVYSLSPEDTIQWTSDGQLIYGAAWPITVVVSALLVLALLIGYIYRSLWA